MLTEQQQIDNQQTDNKEEMKQKFFNTRTAFSIFLLVSLSIPARTQSLQTGEDKLSLLFIGDVMGHDEQIWSAENRETHLYNYDDVFRFIKPVIEDADIAIANFEVTLAGPPYTGYPQFSSPADLAAACKNAGIDYLVTANNHAADRGSKGIRGTINRLDSLGIPHTGTFLNSSSRDSLSPMMINKNGTSIALLNYTFSTNGITVPEPVIVNMLDKDLITRDVNKAKARKADIIILFLHWGTEYDTIPSKTQVDLAAYFQTIGVDMVIGSHPHVLQKMVKTTNNITDRENLVVYSMGNFVSNQRKQKTDGGSMVKVEMAKKGEKYVISNAGYYLTWVYTPIVKYRKKFYILPCSEFENKTDFFDKPEASFLMKRFINDSRKLLNGQNIGVKEYIFNGSSWLLSN
jgi:poly-gamma-glutamate capsule biosynthesis protein CapA/YwtB (metallophosphatase superfamily)